MKCARALELFSSYAENAMEPPLRVALEQHLAECPLCKADYERFNATVMMLEETPEVEPPAGFHAAVMARVERSRRTAPRKVKWWSLDWQRVFTVRVPARALAAGVALILAGVAVVQLAPMQTIGAYLPGIHRTVDNPVGINDSEAPVPKPPTGDVCYGIPDSGVSICVDVQAADRGRYTLTVSSQSAEAVAFSVYTDSHTTPDSSGYVAREQPAVVPLSAGVARVEWEYEGRPYVEYAFMPSNFTAVAAGKSLSVSNTSLGEALGSISQTYGVVVLASGNMERKIQYLDVTDGTPSDALYEVARETGLKWSAIGTSIYLVQPGS
jgi:hypothetical protein